MKPDPIVSVQVFVDGIRDINARVSKKKYQTDRSSIPVFHTIVYPIYCEPARI